MNNAEGTDGRSNALRAATSTSHDRLDKRIMATDPFASRANYGRFLEVQHAFHREIDPLYKNPALAALLPDLEARRRFDRIEQDLADLGMSPAAPVGAPVFPGEPDIPTALGWLFVSEGSNLGAASLLKRAASLELSETFGARHLAPHPEGRGASWRAFTSALDALALSPEEEARVTAGGVAAFAHVHGLVERLLPIEEPASA